MSKKASNKILAGLTDAARYAKHHRPGTHGCHEALHMASFLAEAVNEQLTEHPAVAPIAEWRKLAQTAEDALIELYNAIGKKHL